MPDVVGILVIVLVAVSCRVKRRHNMEEMISQIDPAEQERIKQATKESEEKLEEMKLALQEESEDEIDPDKLLAMLRDDIAAAELKAKKICLQLRRQRRSRREKTSSRRTRRSLMAQLATLEEKEEFTVAKADLLAKLSMPALNAPPPKFGHRRPKTFPGTKTGMHFFSEKFC